MQKKLTQTLHNSLPIIVAGLGSKLGIRVTVSGKGAWTNGSEINIPAFELTSKEDKMAVLGFVSHEAAHIKFNSFQGIDTTELKKNNFLKSIWNIVEDLRIENEMLKWMIGTANWMNQVWINWVADGTVYPRTSKDTPDDIITQYLLHKCRVEYRASKQNDLQPMLDSAENAAIEVFGRKLLCEIEEILSKEIPTLTSSARSVEISKLLEEAIKNHEPENGSDDQPENTDSNSDTENETAEKQPSNSGDSNGDDDSNNQPSNFDDNGQGSRNEAIKSAIKETLESHTEYDPMAKFKTMVEEKSQHFDHSKYVPTEPILNLDIMSEFRDEALELLKSTKKTSSAISSKLQAIVEDEIRVKRKTKKSGSSLNGKVLHRLSVGDQRIFKNKKISIEIDTHVEMLLDVSASMQFFRIYDESTKSLLAISDSLSKINGVKIGASSFPNVINGSGITNLLSSHEPVKYLSNRLCQICASGDHTPSASAIMGALMKLQYSRSQNKVIIMITDGMCGKDQRKALKTNIALAEKSGIKVIGIALGPIAMKKELFSHFFKNSIFIQNIEDLKPELFKLSKSLLF